MDKLVSIVLPTHNRADLLPGAIDSVLAQTYQNWELILVDDASTDETPRIMEEYKAKDPRIRSIRNEPNQRLPKSLNIGFKETRGEYLTWTSDDNFFRPRAIERMVEELDKSPDVGVVYTDIMLINDDEKETGLAAVSDYTDLILWNCVRACFIYRRAVYEKVGDYDPGRFLMEDWDYWLRCSMVSKMKHINEDFYLYRMHEGSLTSTREMEIHRLTARLLEEYLAKLPWARGKIKLNAHLQLVHYGRKSKMYGFMLKHFLKALLMNPAAAIARVGPKAVKRALGTKS